MLAMSRVDGGARRFGPRDQRQKRLTAKTRDRQQRGSRRGERHHRLLVIRRRSGQRRRFRRGSSGRARGSLRGRLDLLPGFARPGEANVGLLAGTSGFRRSSRRRRLGRGARAVDEGRRHAAGNGDRRSRSLGILWRCRDRFRCCGHLPSRRRLGGRLCDHGRRGGGRGFLLGGRPLWQDRYLVRRSLSARDRCWRERRLCNLIQRRARERDWNAECRCVARWQRHDARAVICPEVVARIAVPPPATVAERRTVAGPHRAHHQMEAAALDPGVPSRGARAGCGRIDPGNAHAAATEVEAVHMPAAATAWIGRRAGGVDFALVVAVDFVGAIFGRPHLHPLSVELAVERHVDALSRVRGPARGERENDQRQSPRRRRENAHVAPVARLAIHPRKEGRKRLTSLWHSPADGNRI